jgi:hypothetical protein
MSIDEKVNGAKGFLGGLKDTFSRGKYAMITLAALAALAGSPKDAKAGLLGDPLGSLPAQSVPVSSFAKPANYGNLTGADGDVSSPIWYATSDLGYILAFNGANPTPVSAILTGKDLTGIAYKGNNEFALSAGSMIYEGNLNNGTWNETKRMLLGTSNISDIDFALGSYFIATDGNGIRKVEGDGSTSLVYNQNGCKSVDMITFKENTYDNPLLQFAQNNNGFINADLSGNAFGDRQPMNLNNAVDIQGIAYFGGQNPGFAVVQAPGVQLHNSLNPLQDNMQTIPEPATLAMLGAGALALGAGYGRRKSVESKVVK